MKTIGVVGCGAIGKALIQAAEAGKLSVRIAGVTSRTEAVKVATRRGLVRLD